ncbi:hypothetical protein AOLI_G00139570 [Acnodon oligacanthus]
MATPEGHRSNAAEGQKPEPIKTKRTPRRTIQRLTGTYRYRRHYKIYLTTAQVSVRSLKDRDSEAEMTPNCIRADSVPRDVKSLFRKWPVDLNLNALLLGGCLLDWSVHDDRPSEELGPKLSGALPESPFQHRHQPSSDDSDRNPIQKRLDWSLSRE